MECLFVQVPEQAHRLNRSMFATMGDKPVQICVILQLVIQPPCDNRYLCHPNQTSFLIFKYKHCALHSQIVISYVSKFYRFLKLFVL